MFPDAPPNFICQNLADFDPEYGVESLYPIFYTKTRPKIRKFYTQRRDTSKTTWDKSILTPEMKPQRDFASKGDGSDRVKLPIVYKMSKNIEI